MQTLYNIGLYISENLLKVFGNFFGPKIKKFKRGQTKSWKDLYDCVNSTKPVIWVHVSSLGEYEQALPVIKQLKENHTNYQILVSFFSPSGYENIKDKSLTDCITYLPLDTPKNAKKFIKLVQPKMAIFVKYDLWPNYLRQLQIHHIPNYLISAVFTKNHSYLKYRWLRKILKGFTHIFVQDYFSENILKKNEIQQVSFAGDTRFDRVYQIAKSQNKLEFIEHFKQDKPLFIAGSTWPKDEVLLTKYLNETNQHFKTIIAPHEIDKKHIEQIVANLKLPYILFSQIQPQTDLSSYKVLILDSIGLLKYTYRYADVVYIGNGFGKSIHNVQEPAVYGVPIVTGPNIGHFNEAKALQKLGALMTVQSYVDLKKTLDKLWQNPDLRAHKAQLTKEYISINLGATQKIMSHLNKQL